MKRSILIILILATALTALAQATQPCIVKQYNQKQQKTPLAGVQVTVTNAGNTTSGADGRLTLTFRTLKPGDRVNLISAKKPGYEIFNKSVVEQWTITRGAAFELVLVRSDYFAQLKGRLTQTSTDSYKAKYEQAVRELEQQKKAGKMKEAEYNQKLDELETNYQTQLTNLDNYIDQFARIDLSEVSAEEQRILDMVEEGKIDEAVKAYEALDISGKLRQARENKKALSEAKARIEEEEAQQEQAIADLKEKQKREIATLKLAGGKENYDKVARMLKENALADTTDIEAVEMYALFAYNQDDFKDAEKFLLMSLNGCADNFPKYNNILKLLGNLYNMTYDYSKAEEYLLKALENFTQLSSNNPDAYRGNIADIQNNLGILYSVTHAWSKSEKYYLNALDNYAQLNKQNPDAYYGSLARTQSNLGSLYQKCGYYTKAEEYLLMALDIYNQLFNKKPDANRNPLANTQNDLGNLYTKLHDYSKAEEYYLQALENYTQQFAHNPDAYRAILADIQNNLGAFYSDLHNYAKAEECYLKALEYRTQLFILNPDAFCFDLSDIQRNLGILYEERLNFSDAEAYFIQAHETIMQLFPSNHEKYHEQLERVDDRLLYFYNNILHDKEKVAHFYLEQFEQAMLIYQNNPEEFNYYIISIQDNICRTSNPTTAEKCFLRKEEVIENLYQQDQDKYGMLLAECHMEMSSFYFEYLCDSVKGMDYYLKSEQVILNLYELNPEKYVDELADCLLNLGNFYKEIPDTIKAERYFYKAEELYLKNLSFLTDKFQQVPELYGPDLMHLQMFLASFYKNYLNNNVKAEKYYLMALNSNTSLFEKEPDSFRYDLASIQYNLAELYKNNASKKDQYESMLLAALANYEREDTDDEVISTYIYLIKKDVLEYIAEYAKSGNIEKAEKCLLQLLDIYTQLNQQTPEKYVAKLVSVQNDIGNLYQVYMNDEGMAKELFLKAEDNLINELGSLTSQFEKSPEEYWEALSDAQKNLGNFSKDVLNDNIKAEHYYLMQIGTFDKLFVMYSEKYEDEIQSKIIGKKLATAQKELGDFSRNNLKDNVKAEKYYLMQIGTYDKLSLLFPDGDLIVGSIFSEMACAQDNLGNFYNDLHDYTKTEEFYLKALENRTRLFSQNLDVYRYDLADTQHKLGNLYYLHLQDYAKAEEYYLKALENRSQLFVKDSSFGNCNDLAWTQYRLGSLYNNLHDYVKAEEYYLKALENRTKLYSQNPNTYRVDLANSYNQLAYLYARQKDFTKALETIDRAIELLPEEANYYDSKGEILLMKGDEQEALKMWQKVLEVDPDFLQTHDSDLYKLLKEKGLIND